MRLVPTRSRSGLALALAVACALAIASPPSRAGEPAPAALAAAGAPRVPEPPSATEAQRIAEQIDAAYRMKRAAIWEGARAHFREARERAELERRARRGDRAAIRGLRARRVESDEPRPVVDPVLVNPVPKRTAPARVHTAPTNARCNDPSADPAGTCQSEVAVATIGSHVVIAWNDGIGIATANGDVHGYGWSADGGATWVDGGSAPHPAAYAGFRWIGDPVLVANEKTGEFWYCGLSYPDPTHNAIAVTRGRFVGETFTFDSTFIVRMESNSALFLDKQWMACDSASGTLYVTNTTFGGGGNHIDFYRSTNGGRTWSSAMALSSVADVGNVQGSRIATDGAGNVLATWYAIRPSATEDAYRFRRSSNRGLSFGAETTPVLFDEQFGTGAPGFNRYAGVGFPSLAVDRTSGPHRGRAYLAWAECWNFLAVALPPAGSTNQNEVEFDNSSFTATPFTPGQTLRGTLVPNGTVVDQDWFSCTLLAGQNLIVHADSVDKTTYWYLRMHAPDGTQRLCFGGNPNGTAANEAYWAFTAPVSGTYYLRFLETTAASIAYRIRTGLGTRGSERGRDQRDVFVAWTDDQGTTWSTPVRVNDSGIGYDEYLPEVAVGSDGAVYALWFDHRDEAYGSMTFTYMARSLDGGATWSSNQPVADAQGNFTLSVANIAPNMGDYIHVAAGAGALHPAWGDARGDDVDTWTAAVGTTARIASTPSDTTMDAPGTAAFGWTLVSDNPLFAGDHLVTFTDTRHWPMPAATNVRLGTGSGLPPEGDPSSVFWTCDLTVPDTAVAGPDTVCVTLTSPGGVVQQRACFVVTARVQPVAVEPPAPRGLSLAPGRPNPARGDVALAFTLPHAGRARLVVYDLVGARVRTLLDRDASAGTTSVTWDGRDEHGRRVAAGAYFVRLEFEAHSLTRRIVRL